MNAGCHGNGLRDGHVAVGIKRRGAVALHEAELHRRRNASGVPFRSGHVGELALGVDGDLGEVNGSRLHISGTGILVVDTDGPVHPPGEHGRGGGGPLVIIVEGDAGILHVGGAFQIGFERVAHLPDHEVQLHGQVRDADPSALGKVIQGGLSGGEGPLGQAVAILLPGGAAGGVAGTHAEAVGGDELLPGDLAAVHPFGELGVAEAGLLVGGVLHVVGQVAGLGLQVAHDAGHSGGGEALGP